MFLYCCYAQYCIQSFTITSERLKLIKSQIIHKIYKRKKARYLILNAKNKPVNKDKRIFPQHRALKDDLIGSYFIMSDQIGVFKSTMIIICNILGTIIKNN